MTKEELIKLDDMLCTFASMMCAKSKNNCYDCSICTHHEGECAVSLIIDEIDGILWEMKNGRT